MAPRVAAGETVGVVFGRERIRAREPRGRARRPHRHAAGQSGLRLAQSGAGGGDRRLRMVQARDRRRAAVRHAAEIAAGGQAAAARVLRRSRTRAGEGRILPARRTSATPCRSTCATSSTAWRRPSRTSRPCTASSWRSPRAARARRAAACSTATRPQMLRTLLAEHGAGRVPDERAPVRGLARLLRRNPTEAERTFWDALIKDRRFAGRGFKRQVPVGPHIADFVSFPLRVRDRSRAGGRRARRRPRRAPTRRAWLAERGYRVVEVAAARRRERDVARSVLDDGSAGVRDQPLQRLELRRARRRAGSPDRCRPRGSGSRAWPGQRALGVVRNRGRGSCRPFAPPRRSGRARPRRFDIADRVLRLPSDSAIDRSEGPTNSASMPGVGGDRVEIGERGAASRSSRA